MPTPTRNGYTFDGWYTANFGGVQIYANTIMGTSDTIVYAQWSRTRQVLTFTMATGSFTSPVIDTTDFTKMTVVMTGCAHGENAYFDGTWTRQVGINGNFEQGSSTYGWSVTPNDSVSAYLILNGANSAYVSTLCYENTCHTSCDNTHTITVILE